MLKWRLSIGIPLVLLVALLCWLDAGAAVPGLYLIPLFLLSAVFLCVEILDMLNAAGLFPRRSTVFAGTLFMMIWCWLAGYKMIPHLTSGGWDAAAVPGLMTLLAMAGGIIIAFTGEMVRFKKPGGNITNLAGAIFAIAYIGVLGCFMIMLRIAYGVGALVSLVITAKMCDIGAYFIGRLIGRHKLAADLSPGKTIEGGIGGLAFAVLGAWLSIEILNPCLGGGSSTAQSGTGIWIFGILVGIAGALGDLAESLLKRDVQMKDSGRLVPGFGGFLDMFDSLLLAAPVAFGLWTFGVIH